MKTINIQSQLRKDRAGPCSLKCNIWQVLDKIRQRQLYAEKKKNKEQR
ncbi:MAG: hypothetical protein ABIK33_05985 [candidate division WOR-3 bacterium]